MSEKENPFADMEVDWENVEKAKPGMSTGRIPPYPAYRGVCVAFDAGDGNMIDHQLLEPAGKNKGVKISIEILEPSEIEGEAVKGKSYEHVFWISAANWPYVKRDAEAILGSEPKNPQALLAAVWAGRTVEFGIKDETYNGFMRSKSTHFNFWIPENAEAKKTDQKAAAGQKKAESPAAGAKATAAGSKAVASTKAKAAEEDIAF
jgi:hypothetical protein